MKYASVQTFPVLDVYRVTVQINSKNCAKPCLKDSQCNLILDVDAQDIENGVPPRLKEIKCTPLNFKTTGTPLAFYKTPPGVLTKINLNDQSNYEYIQILAQKVLAKSNPVYKNKDYDLKLSNASVESFPNFRDVFLLSVHLNYKNCQSPCRKDTKCNFVVTVGDTLKNNQIKIETQSCDPIDSINTGTLTAGLKYYYKVTDRAVYQLLLPKALLGLQLKSKQYNQKNYQISIKAADSDNFSDFEYLHFKLSLKDKKNAKKVQVCKLNMITPNNILVSFSCVSQ